MLDALADPLGYADVTSYFRACNYWEGVIPGEWRVTYRAVA